jgi:hypothetical protein
MTKVILKVYHIALIQLTYIKQKNECSTFKSAQKLMEIPNAFTFNYFLKLIEDMPY